MKPAISQMAWEPFAQPEALALLQELGFAGLEVMPGHVAGPNPYESLAEAGVFAAAQRENHGLSICSLQGIWWGVLGSLFGEGKDDLTEATKGAIRFAQATGAGNIVIGGPGQRVMPSPQVLEARGSSVRKAEEDVAALFHEWGEYAALHGTCIGLEALPPSFETNFLNVTEDAFTFASRADSPGCKVTLDWGTLLANGESPELLRGRVDMVSHVHVSEPGQGPLSRWEEHEKLAAVLREEGYRGYVSIEMKSQPLEVLRRVAATFMEVFGA